MTFTKSQLKELSKWESYFDTAVHSQWASCPPRADLVRMNEIYNEATGETGSFDMTCGRCILKKLIRIGTMYYDDIAESARKKKKTDA